MIKKFLLILVITGSTISAFSQTEPSDSTTTKKEKKDKKVDLTVMPFVSYNRNLHFMFGVMPMAMYKINANDSISPKSLSGLSPIITTNGSKFIGFFNKLYFAEDTWRIFFFGGTGDLSSQFFMEEPGSPGQFYEYLTNSTVISVGFKRKLFNHWYGGLSYMYANHHTTYEDDVQPESNTITNGLSLDFLWDTRDAVYYPTVGKFVKFKWSTFPDFMKNEVDANKIKTEYNQYFPMREGKDVLAARFSGVFGVGNIVFEQQVTVGGKDIRGYSQGKYRGDGIIAFQGEYRYNFENRMGLVGFAGLATIYGSDTEDFNWGLYPGIGAGYRYQAFKANKFNIGLDAAVGKGDWGVYFRIGEAF